MADFNKTFGDVSARLAMVGYDTDTAGRDNVNTKRYGFAPSIAWQITDKTKNTLSYVYQNDDNIADRGIPMLPGSYFGTSYRQPAPVPRNTYYGLLTPGQDDVERTEAHNLTNKFEHEFVPGLKFTNTTGYSAVDRFNRTRRCRSRHQHRDLEFVERRRRRHAAGDAGQSAAELPRRCPTSGSPTPTISRTRPTTS